MILWERDKRQVYDALEASSCLLPRDGNGATSFRLRLQISYSVWMQKSEGWQRSQLRNYVSVISADQVAVHLGPIFFSSKCPLTVSNGWRPWEGKQKLERAFSHRSSAYEPMLTTLFVPTSAVNFFLKFNLSSFFLWSLTTWGLVFFTKTIVWTARKTFISFRRLPIKGFLSSFCAYWEENRQRIG